MPLATLIQNHNKKSVVESKKFADGTPQHDDTIPKGIAGVKKESLDAAEKWKDWDNPEEEAYFPKPPKLEKSAFDDLDGTDLNVWVPGLEYSIIHPDSVFYRYWNVALAFVTVTDSGLTPIAIAWTESNPGINGVLIFTDLFFAVNILVTFRTAFYHEHVLVVDTGEIATEYMRFWFWLDFICTMPWDIMFQSFSYVQLARLLRILRVLRFTKIVSIQVSDPFVVLTKLSVYVLFIGHWVGCIWWAMGKDNADNGFGPSSYVVESNDQGLQLSHSMYWGLQALTGLGSNLRPQEKSECVLCIFICLAGSFMLSYILGEVFNVIQVINATSVRYSAMMHELNEFIEASTYLTLALAQNNNDVNLACPTPSQQRLREPDHNPVSGRAR